MVELVTSHVGEIVALVTAATTLAAKVSGVRLFGQIREAAKEVQDVKSYWKVANADGRLTEDEKDRLLKEAMEALDKIDDVVSTGFSIWKGLKKK